MTIERTPKPDWAIQNEMADSKSQAKQRKAQGAERTHYADDETLAYIAELEQERDELRNMLFVDRDEWRRFRVHGDTVLALEAAVEREARLREAIGEIVMVHALRRLRALKQGGNSD